MILGQHYRHGIGEGIMANDSSLELLSEVLDKLIETQIQTAQATADLRNAVQDNNEHLKELHILISSVNAHFSNGFRLEIKEHIEEIAKTASESLGREISVKAEEGKQETNAILESLKEFISAIKSPKAWISAFLVIAGIVSAIAGVVTIIIKLMGGL